MKITIALRGGAVIEFDAAGITTERNPISGQFTKVKWTHLDDPGAAKLHGIDPAEIAAIVCKEATG